MANNSADFFTIDAVSGQLGVTARTLRYYEEVGLITPASRTSGGHRLYNQNTIERVKQILRLKDSLGMSLQEIQEIMAAEESLRELQQTFHENDQSYDTQKLIVERYVDVLHDLIGKMNTKIENVSMMRDMYEERMERSIRFLNDMEAK